MPFENTHLFLADKVRQSLQDSGLTAVLEENLDHFHLGAIFPDTLFYSRDDSLFQTAYRLHGEDGSLTNRFVFKVLDRIRESENSLNFAFIAGYLTHCAADMTFHPLIFYLSGYQANGSKSEEQRSSYRHWQYETLIDSLLNDGFSLEAMVHPGLIEELVAPQVLDIDAGRIVEALKRQRLYFSMVRNRFFYHLFRLLHRVGAVPPETVAGFYENLKTGDVELPETIHYRDILSGNNRETTLEAIVAGVVDLGCRLVDAAYGYYTGAISREACEHTIAGENLDTGQVGKTRQDIRFSLSTPTAEP